MRKLRSIKIFHAYIGSERAGASYVQRVHKKMHSVVHAQEKLHSAVFLCTRCTYHDALARSERAHGV